MFFKLPSHAMSKMFPPQHHTHLICFLNSPHMQCQRCSLHHFKLTLCKLISCGQSHFVYAHLLYLNSHKFISDGLNIILYKLISCGLNLILCQIILCRLNFICINLIVWVKSLFKYSMFFKFSMFNLSSSGLNLNLHKIIFSVLHKLMSCELKVVYVR